MADDNTSQTAETSSGNGESAAKEWPKTEETPTQPGTAEGQQESGTKGMLREAIRKVMEEIEHHEREAKRHLQQAKALRKDLRDSFAFLQERKDDEPAGITGVTSEDTGGKPKDVVPASKPQPAKAKKRSASRKKAGPNS
jgi:hypothetical protein